MCVCGFDDGENTGNCERCDLIQRIRQLERIVDQQAADVMQSAVPDRVGVWRLTDQHGEITDFDVYELPTGDLCAWCEDVDAEISGESAVWDNDEWIGHVPVSCMSEYGKFEFVG